MMLRPLKFIVQVVLLEMEGDAIMGEQISEPSVLYSLDALRAFADDFEAQVDGRPRDDSSGQSRFAVEGRTLEQ